MKIKTLIMAGILSGFFALFGYGKEPEKTKYPIAEIYKDLRNQVLSLDPKTISLNTSSSNRVWGVLMETGFPEAVVTLVTIADGTVSLYFSSGGGTIGVGQHEGPRKAGNELLVAAPRFLQHAKPTTEFPLPTVGRTRFYFMTFDGIFTTEAIEEELGNDRSPLSPLFHKAHEVIAQARFAEEKVRQSAPRMLRAAATGNLKELKELLEEGISPEVADKTGVTPLMAAAYEGKTETVKLLLDSGAKIDATDSSGYTALLFACNNGKKESAELLIKKGADINHRDKDSSTAIMFAAQHGHNETVRLLLEHGADPEYKGKHGLSAIGFAKQNRHTETERILTQKK